MPGEGLLRDSERALDAVYHASPTTRQKVTTMLQDYSQTLTRKIDRLNSMLQDPSNILDLAFDDASLPYRAIEASMKQMFRGVRHNFDADGCRGDSPITCVSNHSDDDLVAHLREASRYDAAETKAIALLRTLEDATCQASDELLRLVEDVEETLGLCMCSSCYTHTVGKLDRLLDICLSYSRDGIYARATKHHLESPQSLKKLSLHAENKSIILDLEALALETQIQKREMEIALLHALTQAHAGPSKKRPGDSMLDNHDGNLSDYVLTYCHLLMGHSSDVAAQLLEQKTLARFGHLCEISGRLSMIQRCLDRISAPM